MVYKLIRVMDVGYREADGEVIVWLTGRDADGDRHHVEIEGTLPYAFVPADYEIPDEDYILSVDRVAADGSEFAGYDEMPLRKVTVRLPRHVNNRRGYDCLTDHIPKEYLYEGDIPYPRRVGVDYGLSGYIRVPKGDRVHIRDVETDIDPTEVETIEPRVMMADIEAKPPRLRGDRDFQDFVDDASQPIISITTYDSYADEYLIAILDREDMVNPGELRGYLEDHWGDHDLADQFVDADMRLVQCEDEASLLETFIAEVERCRPDLLSGWNWVDFDHKYIINRLKRDEFSDLTEHRLSDAGTVGGYKTAEMIDGLPGFDMMDAYTEKMTFGNWKSKSLDYVAQEELGLGKVEEMSIEKEYRQNRSRFLAYNIIDTQLLVAMDARNGIHEFFYQLADLSSVQIYDTFSEMRLVDGFVLSRRGPQEILPSSQEKDLGKIAGGLVLTPSDGVNEWVAVLDLKSLYPSIFITLNVSEETLTKTHEVDPNMRITSDGGTVTTELEANRNPNPPDYICPSMPESEDAVGGEITDQHISWDLNDPVAMGTRTHTEGILPKYLKLLFDERDAMKTKRDQFDPEEPQYDVYDNKQGAVKVIMNSFYGVSQNAYYRLSNPIQGDDGIGSTITAGGRYVLWRGAQIMQEMGYDVKYGDTDSVMIQLAEDDEDVTPKEVVARGKEVERELNDRMDEVADEFGIGDEHPYLKDADLHGNDRHCLHWEFEKLYRRFLQAGSKKRYAGLPVWKEGKWYIDEPDSGDYTIEGVKPDVTGFESQRSDTPEITAEIQEEMIERVLAGHGFEELSAYLGGMVERIRTLDLPVWKIANPGVLNKPLAQYGNTQTARACRYSNEHLDHDWRDGDDPWVYYIRRTPPMTEDTDVLALEWGEPIPDGYVLDTGKVVQKKVEKPLEPILGETEWTFAELESGRRMEGLDTEGGTNPFADAAPPGVTNGDSQNPDNADEGGTDGQRPADDADPDDDGDDNRDAAADALSW